MHVRASGNQRVVTNVQALLSRPQPPGKVRQVPHTGPRSVSARGAEGPGLLMCFIEYFGVLSPGCLWVLRTWPSLLLHSVLHVLSACFCPPCCSPAPISQGMWGPSRTFQAISPSSPWKLVSSLSGHGACESIQLCLSHANIIL